MNYKDRFGKDVKSLKNKKLFLLDMDGTIYEDGRIFDGTLDFLKQIKDNGGNYVFITNNSSRSVNDYVEKLINMGIPAKVEDFFTSTHAAVSFLNDKFDKKRVFVVGTKSFVNELLNLGIDVTEDVDSTASVVLVGYDTELTYEKLRRASEMLCKYDVEFIATHPDRACPVDFGFIPDCAAICQALSMATGKYPIFMGKPEPAMAYFAMKKYNASIAETVMIGDRLYTDIAMGINSGIETVCVLSGESKMSDIIEGNIKPDFVLDDIVEICNIIRQ